jgi:hypothetical protein
MVFTSSLQEARTDKFAQVRAPKDEVIREAICVPAGLKKVTVILAIIMRVTIITIIAQVVGAIIKVVEIIIIISIIIISGQEMDLKEIKPLKIGVRLLIGMREEEVFLLLRPELEISPMYWKYQLIRLEKVRERLEHCLKVSESLQQHRIYDTKLNQSKMINKGNGNRGNYYNNNNYVAHVFDGVQM